MVDFGIEETVKGVRETFGKYVVAPATQFGLGGFIFDVEGATSIDLTADITDHFTEANYSVQDHIALRPKRIRLDTYVGEVVYRPNDGVEDTVQNVVRKLTVLNSYLPSLTTGAQQALSIYESGLSSLSFQKAVDSSLSIYSLVKNVIPPTTKQQQAYQYFKALMENKILMSVQTPFEFCTNMAIEAVFATQEEDSKFISNFSILLKEIRLTATTNIISRSIQRLSDRAGIQDATSVNGGSVQGADVTPASRVDLFGAFGELLQ